MAVLNEQAVLKLIVDSAQGVASLEEFQKKFDEGFSNLAGLARDTTEEVEKLGEGINHTNDPLRAYASLADDAGIGTKEWAKAISLVDPQLGAMLSKLNALNSALPGNVALIARFAGVAGVATAAGLALGNGLQALATDLGDQNKALGLTADLLKTLGFREAGQELDEYVDKVRLGTLILNGMAREEAQVRLELEKARDAVEGDRRGIEQRILALREYRRELEASAVSEQEKARLLARLAVQVREVIAEVDEYGTTVKDGTSAEREFVEWLEKREAAMAQSTQTTEEATKAEEERWTELEKELDKATGATEDNTKAVKEQAPAYKSQRDAIAASTSVLRDHIQALRESVNAQREASGIDEREQAVADLREEVEALQAAEFRTIEQENRADQAKQDLIDAERELQDALGETTLFYDEHNLAVAESELAAIEAEEQQRKLAEALGQTTEEVEGQVEQTTELTEEFENLKETVVGSESQMVATLKKIGEAARAEITACNALLDATKQKLIETKQCAVELAGAIAGET